MATVKGGRVKLTREFWEALREQTAPALASKGQAVAAGAQAISGKPTVCTMKRDRNGDPVALVTIAHASGVLQQIRKGALTKAASAEGLQVERYSGRL